MYTSTILSAITFALAFSISYQAFGATQAAQACLQGDPQGCKEVMRFSTQPCRAGDQQACADIRQAYHLMKQAQIRGGYQPGMYDESGISEMPATNGLLGDINGRGPGGADYTNEAAKRVYDGTLSPLDAAIGAMGGNR